MGRNFFNCTPIFKPLECPTQYSTELVQILIDGGANINATNEIGNTPLHLSLVIFMNSCLDDNLDLDDLDGVSSAVFEQWSGVNLLLAAGAEKNIRNGNNQTPIEYAKKLCFDSIQTRYPVLSDLDSDDLQTLYQLHTKMWLSLLEL